ncbi:type II secretion system minor pseudopilin GspJ [Novosphingobium lentum]|uniref:type II secretion system minor pseudopilin GspJ n=1 Tax=Novosphingobium lentum TaxID=145287 RepID=UPI00082E65EF|nr:type II secretion system minor pseudopilin GspJ [Novosphingobium lentum]
MKRAGRITVSRSEAGFTLVEMLIALAIFAVIAGGALALLRFSVDAELASRHRTDRIAEDRRFLAVWTADLAQATPRTARDETGTAQPALDAPGAGTGGLLLRLTRSGWANVDGAPRPSLEKVEYRWQGGKLLRAGYPFPDGAAADPATAVLDAATVPALRFRTRDGLWHTSWQPERDTELPVAIEITLPRSGGRALRIVSLVGVNYQ